jgi:hypothetical protein
LTKIQQLKEKLEKGFYTDNLYEMSRLCGNMALESDNPAPLFIMQKIFSGIADYWDDRPIIVEDSNLVQTELIGSIQSLVNALEDEVPLNKLMELSNKAVSSYYFLFR